jgi:hypothetical protein
MAAATKFLQLVSSANEELNRVQNNVAEAFRLIENRIAVAITTINTNIYNSIVQTINNVAPGAGWDAYETSTVVSYTNVSTQLARWTIPPGAIWNVYSLTMGKGTSALFNSFSQDGWAIAYRQGSAAAGLVTGVGGLTGGAGSVTFTVVANDLILSVVGSVAEPVTNWRTVVRRLSM